MLIRQKQRYTEQFKKIPPTIALLILEGYKETSTLLKEERRPKTLITLIVDQAGFTSRQNTGVFPPVSYIKIST